MRFYIYKLLFMSGATYIGEHLEKIANDGYITSSKYFKEHSIDDPLIKREILIELKDEETMHFMETVCIMQDKRDNPKNVNGTLGSFIFRYSSYRGKFVSEETRKKCSEASKKRTVTEETRKKISLAQKGKPESDKTKKAISARLKGNSYRKGTKTSEIGKQHIKEAAKRRVANGWISPLKGKPGRKHTPEELEKMSQASKNRIHKKGYSINFKNAEERAQKISNSLKGRPSHAQSEKSRKSISEKLTGIKRSDETKKRMSEANKGKVYITNGTLVKKVSKEEAELFLKNHTDWHYGSHKRRKDA